MLKQKKKQKTRDTIDMNKLTEERTLLIRKKVRVSPGFVAHAEYVIRCATYYTS